jgi:hypothetical protein
VKLELDDIVDLRAYEREREAFRTHVIDLKRRRRVEVGPLVSVVFENRDTVRFQVQEMARAERMLTDAAIQDELDVYNPLIPGPGELSATLFLELTTPAELREWLPKLVGIEQAVALRVGAVVVRADVEEAHAGQLTRDDVTASVHYLRWSLGPGEIEAWRTGAVALLIDHPAYHHEVPLSPPTRQELLGDLVRGG